MIYPSTIAVTQKFISVRLFFHTKFGSQLHNLKTHTPCLLPVSHSRATYVPRPPPHPICSAPLSSTAAVHPRLRLAPATTAHTTLHTFCFRCWVFSSLISFLCVCRRPQLAPSVRRTCGAAEIGTSAPHLAGVACGTAAIVTTSRYTIDTPT